MKRLLSVLCLVLLVSGFQCKKDPVDLDYLAGYWDRYYPVGAEPGVSEIWWFGNGDLFISVSGSTLSFGYEVGEDRRTLSIKQAQAASMKVVAKYTILRCDDQILSLRRIEMSGVVDEFAWDAQPEFWRHAVS